MKRPGVLLEHHGQTYLCVEGGFNDESRSVTLLAGADDPHFPPADGMRPMAWRDQGDWYPVARLTQDELVLQDERHHDERPYAEEVIRHYLDDRPATPERAWALEGPTGFGGRLVDILPQGLAVVLAADLDEAGALLEQRRDDHPGERMVPVTHLAGFLTHLAREGYAGALREDGRPIFFCVDDEGALQFLRLGRETTEDGSLAMEILGPEDTWGPYDGAEQISFLDNADACDARLGQVLGEVPLLDWPGSDGLWSVGPSRLHPGIVAIEEDGLEYGLLFGDAAAAEAWLEDVEEPWLAWPVEDLSAWLAHAELRERGGLLNPGAHRARRAVVWRDQDRTVFDTFSGFWVLDDEGRWHPVNVGPAALE